MNAGHRSRGIDCSVESLNDDEFPAAVHEVNLRDRQSRVLRYPHAKASFSTVFGYAAWVGFRMCVDWVPSTGRLQEPSVILVRSSFSRTPARDSLTLPPTPRGPSIQRDPVSR